MHDDESALAGTEVHYRRSAAVGDEFKVFIGRCPGRDRRARMHVLYVPDGNGYFGMVVDIIRGMQLASHLPPILVVGIGYRLGAIDETLAVRTRDLTPTDDRAYVKLIPEHAELGGSGAFLDFVADELAPWVEATFPVLAGDRTYFGHSLGGLFGTYAMLTRPDLFRRLIISSPSYWWHRNAIRGIEAEYAAAHDDLAARVFFAIGADETHEGRGREASRQSPEQQEIARAWYIDMVADLRAFTEQLQARQYPSLQLELQVYADEFHVTVAPLSLSRGLRALFDAPR